MAGTLVKIKRELVKALSGLTLKSVTADYMGMPLKVPVVHGVVERGHMTPGEFWMGDCLKAFLDTREGAVIDIGVNVGAYLVKLRVLSRERQYMGFEPNPYCLLYVQELIRLNRFNNSSVFPFALFDRSEVSRFIASKPGDKTGSLIADFKADENKDFAFDVLTMVGDDVIDDIGPDALSVIKIDVEEAELHVLHGLSKTITRYRPYLYCEVLNPEGEASRQEKSAEVFSLIRGHKYTVLGLDRDANELRIIENLAGIGTNYKDEFVFCPNEMLAGFSQAIRDNSSGAKIAF